MIGFLSRKKIFIDCAYGSKIGTRKVNEDSVLVLNDDDRHLFVVADGLGGHGMGDVASDVLVSSFNKSFCEWSGGKNVHFLRDAFDKAQEAVLLAQKSCAVRGQMKTTAVVLSISGNRCAWGHVGDSRLYRFRKQRFIERTLDHSVTQMLALAKEIKEEDIATHPDRSILLCAVGDKWTKPRYEISKEVTITAGDAFFLCSDGVWENAVVIRDITQPAKLWLGSVMQAIEAAPADKDIDNYTAIAVNIARSV